MPTLPRHREVTTGPYFIGIVLALVLTVIPFGLVAGRTLPPIWTFVIIGVSAIMQVIVHLRFFLHLELRPSSQERLIALYFAFLILFILAGGTLWIMFDLHHRMM